MTKLRHLKLVHFGLSGLYSVKKHRHKHIFTFISPLTTSVAEFHLVFSDVEAHSKFPLAQRMSPPHSLSSSPLVSRLFPPQSVSLCRKELIYLQSSKDEFTTDHNVHCTFPAPADRSTQRDGTWVKVHVPTLFYCIWSIWSESKNAPCFQKRLKFQISGRL